MERSLDSQSNEDQGTAIGLGTNQGGMREHNERVVLTLLRRHANLAKADIARRTGLSAQTVARLIGSLEGDGLIIRGTPSRGRIGQPSVPLSLDPTGVVFLGMKVGRRSVEMVAVDFLGKIIDREKQIYDYPDFDQVLQFAKSSSAALRRRLSPHLKSRIAGLGIAMPFFLWNWAAHLGVDAGLMANWEHRNLQSEVAKELGIPVFLQNDATSTCSAEMVFGARPLPANALCFFIAFFVGGGLALGNSLYTGSSGNAAGFGPLRVPDLNGVSRPLIELASLATLENTLLQNGFDPRQMWIDPENWDLPADLIAEWSEQCAHALAHAIQSVQAILDLELVLLDGWIPRALCKNLTERVATILADLDMTGMHRPVIATGTLGADARVLGAASLPLSHRFLVQ
ncbi:ROK family transcriptional regulator [Yoonia sp.]|uniref:ROK family transcriptional regulator n=1 Tax=Yoonia sp. TaxID=2212373 RepID=UPI003F6C9460